MAVITAGAGATDRSSAQTVSGITKLERTTGCSAAGTINTFEVFIFSAGINVSNGYLGMFYLSSGDVYACVYNGDIYKQAGGTGDFVALGQTSRYWYGMAAAPNGSDYTCRDSENVGTIVKGSKQTFTGLNCDAQANDLVGLYSAAGGGIEADENSNQGWSYPGNGFTATRTYISASGPFSLYASGSSPSNKMPIHLFFGGPR